jgi:hypothetical protein
MKPNNVALVAVTLAILLVGSAAFAANSVSVTAGAAHNGTNFGLLVTVDSNTAAHVQSDHPNAENVYRARFWVRPQTLPIAMGQAGVNHIKFFVFLDPGNLGQHVLGYFTRSAGDQGWHLILWAKEDSGDFKSVANIFLGGAAAPARQVEVQWAAASAPGANDGMLMVSRIDNPAQTSGQTNLDNDTGDVDGFRIGYIPSVNNVIAGNYSMDEFESFRTLAP